MDYSEIDITKLPRSQKRFRLQLVFPAGDRRVGVYNEERTEYEATKAEVIASIDPSEVLDYVTVPELIEAGAEHSFFDGIAEDDRTKLLTQLEGVCEYEVSELLDIVKAAIMSGRPDDALLAIERHQSPKYPTKAAFELAFKAAVQA